LAVFLSEPSSHEWDVHFSLLGYPVRIHPMFWVVMLIFGPLRSAPVNNLLWVVAVLFCILLHELGHAVVMKYYGFYPSIVLYSFGGLAIPHRGTSSARRPGPWGDMLIAFAGPASGFILAAILVVGLHYLGRYPVVWGVAHATTADLRPGGGLLVIFNPTWRDVMPVWCEIVREGGDLYIQRREDLLGVFVNSLFYITVWWGLLNLLPIYPLDGGQIVQQIFYLNNPRDAIRPTLILSVVVGGLLTAYFLVQMLQSVHSLSAREMDWNAPFRAAFFGYLTFTNYELLQSQRTRGGW
jgi:stage IV sporulation protein FB